MKIIKTLTILFLLLIMVSCNTQTKQITSCTDYEQYLDITTNTPLEFSKKELKYWSTKYQENPSQFIYISKIAHEEGNLFKHTGDIKHLINQYGLLTTINEKTNYRKASYLRALAHNCISQHKFNQALELLLKAETNGESLIATHKMLFDVYLELGDKVKAKKYLNTYKNFKDFDYLIRLSKWNDHNGDLDSAIHFMEKALTITLQNKSDDLTQWAYTNLADYYGHAGKIEKSYQYYLKALVLNPNDNYALKGIAWIVYSYEENPTEAIRMIDRLIEKNQSPDYYLLKAEIAQSIDDTANKDINIAQFLEKSTNSLYGEMYNKYHVLLYADDENQIEKAIEISIKEIDNRPTAQSYDLLAWSLYKNNEIEKALEISEKHVVNTTTEPEVLFHLATIYKANNQIQKVSELKPELISSAFELGPVAFEEIIKL